MQEPFHRREWAALPETGHDRGRGTKPGKSTLPQPCAPEPLNPVPDLLHHPPSRDDRAGPSPHEYPHMSAYKSDFLQRAGGARLHPPGVGARRPGSARQVAADHRLYRLRLHRGLAAHRLAAADHDAALDAADRPPADRADGRRHHAGRRSLRQGRKPPHPDRRDDQPEPRRHPRDLRQVPQVRGRSTAGRQRHHGEQRRLAEHAQLHRLPARRRPALLGQPDAVVRTR